MVQTIQVRKELDIRLFLRKAIPFFGIGSLTFAAAFGVGAITGDDLWGFVLQVAAGGAVYLGLSAVYCIKTKNIIYSVVKRILTKNKTADQS